MPSASDRGLQAVFFDLDGLLVDSEPLWFEAESAVADRLGSGPWTHADQRFLLGGTMERTVGYLLERAVIPTGPEQVARWLIDAMTGLIASRGLSLQPGAGELHARLVAAGVPVGLVSSSKPQVVAAALAATGLAFDAVITGADVANGKPHPEPYLRAVRELGADPDRCVALEDSVTGAASARAAGCAVVLVPEAGLAGAGLAGAGLAGAGLAGTGPADTGPAGGWDLLAGSLAEVDLAALKSLTHH